jgi:GH24 family phage-related lysozyme (muramidase)
MHLKSANFKYYWHSLSTVGIILSFALTTSNCHASTQVFSNQSNTSTFNKVEPRTNSKFDLTPPETLIISGLPVLPAASSLIKQFEGFRPTAYIDTSGLPVVGYGQTRVNGKTVQLGQSISQEQANLALEQELLQIQQLVLAHVKVDLNPYQLGALTSLVYNAGTAAIRNSTLIKKLNAGDYLGASQEFLRWNKANSGGALVVLPGLTKRRAAEQQLFLTPHKEVASNN